MCRSQVRVYKTAGQEYNRDTRCERGGGSVATVNMTEGNIPRQLVGYAVPLVVGNLFQLTYNAADSIIAGRLIGKQALAATGMASPVMNLLILGISGICMGAGVLMSEYFGAGTRDKLRREVATTLLFGLLFSAAVALAGIVCAAPLLRLLQVPDELLGMTAVYLRIIFVGAPFTYFYNALSAALKSVGDARTPLRFLMLSSVLNIVLDLIFIGLLGFGIVCSAVTTVVAEAVSAALSLGYVYRCVPLLQLQRHEWRIERPMLRRTLRYGLVTALQQACQPVGKLLVQGTVNTLGVDVIAAFNAVTRVDDFAFTPEQSIAHGITTFVAQNRGAGQHRRAREGLRVGLRLEMAYWVLICAAVLLLRYPLMGLFVRGDDAQAIVVLGARYLGAMAFFYLLPAFTNGIQGFMRGAGQLPITLLCTFIQTALRVVGTVLLAPRWGILGISAACAVGWSAMLLFEVPYYFHFVRRQGRDGPPPTT